MNLDDLPRHPVPTTTLEFSELGLAPPILAAIKKLGFTHPTPIQAAVIPAALEGRDVIGLAQTGSGKTAAFALPLAERLTHGRGLRGLIVSPTREIALQTKAFLDLFGQNHKLKTIVLIGGVKMNPQFDDLKSGPDIVVATPGRLLDHLERRTIRLDEIEELVLDEGDHMLDLGFLPQVQKIMRALPAERQTMMFSATMPDSIEQLASKYMKDPLRIDILPKGAAHGISHRLYLVLAENKRNCLLNLLQQELGTTLVFARRKIDAEWLAKILQRQGHPVESMHSDRTQKQRVNALENFRQGQHRILVATDIAGRGIDVPSISHVVNFDIPETVEDYIHRAGRTARGEAEGLVSTIATWQDLPLIREIEKRLGGEIARCTIPGVPAYVESKNKPVRTRRFR
ncbi:MAG: DEAD/DEAH box helicase [Acidobacteriota bacterium]